MKIFKQSSWLLVWYWLMLAPSVQAEACNSPPSPVIPDIRLALYAEGLDEPVSITHANDGSGRLFVVEQAGLVKIILQAQVQPRPFIDMRSKVVAGGEKGLLGLAFHPRFKQNRRFFLNYTRNSPRLQTVVAEYRIDSNGQADVHTERILLTVDQPYGNHNGGQLAFGPDGYLYISLGDGGSANDPHNNGQNLTTLLGKILRIDVDNAAKSTAYAIPADNPYVEHKNARPEIWAWGLRNPWRFSFDRLTGELYAADVGQDEVEEIDIIEKGNNYGWRIMEGNICTPDISVNCDKNGLTAPIFAYTHDTGRSITGGYVYRGQAIPALCGVYLYGDFVNQAIWGLRYQQGKVIQHKTLFEARSLLRLAVDYFRDDGLLISTFGEDESGELYVAAYASGRIYKVLAK